VERGEGFEPAVALLLGSRSWSCRAGDLRFLSTCRDHSCPPGARRDRCGTDPTQTNRELSDSFPRPSDSAALCDGKYGGWPCSSATLCCRSPTCCPTTDHRRPAMNRAGIEAVARRAGRSKSASMCLFCRYVHLGENRCQLPAYLPVAFGNDLYAEWAKRTLCPGISGDGDRGPCTRLAGAGPQANSRRATTIGRRRASVE
jgi:hypothetical protein